MKLILVSGKTLPDERKMLGNFGKVVVLPMHPALPEPINSHPDTLFAYVSGTLFTFGDYLTGFLDEYNISYIKTAEKAGNIYPADAALNCFELSGALFCRKKSISPQISAFAEKSGLIIADVNQGYAHCASAVFGNAIISSDDGIILQAEKLGMPSLKISPGGVSLEGYSCGFIGGSCALIDNTAVFFGNPLTHPDGEKIIRFIYSLGYEVLPLSDGELRDCGGIIMLGN